jgi:hypothetical protein
VRHKKCFARKNGEQSVVRYLSPVLERYVIDRRRDYPEVEIDRRKAMETELFLIVGSFVASTRGVDGYEGKHATF